MADQIHPDAPPSPGPFDAVVFAGGGCRCFWQAGFWAEAAPALGIAPSRVGGVSAGAAVACAIFGGRMESVLEDFVRRAEANPRNVYPANALRGEPLFPHERIYRRTILDNLDDEALARLQRGPEIRISVGRPPPWSSGRGAYLLGLLTYVAEQRVRPRLHATWGRRLGFRSEVVPVSECETPEALADLILHSSCTPPVTPVYRRGGGTVIDGGVVDAVPVESVSPARSTLVLLSRHEPDEHLPQVAGRTYVSPSRPIPVAKWDYTSGDGVRRTFELGREDGAAFVRDWLRRAAA